jgi:hypothetical protein
MSRQRKSREVSRTRLSESDNLKLNLKRRLNRAQEETASPTLKLTAFLRDSDEVVSNLMEFHMTIRSKITDLTANQASMLLAICCYRALHNGVDFTLYLSMEFLYNLLWKNGQDPIEIRNEKVRRTLFVTDIIFSYIRGNWFTFKDVEELPADVKEQIESLKWLPSFRTMQSWKQNWQLEKYLEIRIVPVESLINRNKFSPAQRYSGYTKGYGNDGSPAHPGKTKPSAELDGTDSEEYLPRFSLQEFDEFQTAIRLIEYAKAQRRQQK